MLSVAPIQSPRPTEGFGRQQWLSKLPIESITLQSEEKYSQPTLLCETYLQDLSAKCVTILSGEKKTVHLNISCNKICFHKHCKIFKVFEKHNFLDGNIWKAFHLTNSLLIFEHLKPENEKLKLPRLNYHHEAHDLSATEDIKGCRLFPLSPLLRTIGPNWQSYVTCTLKVSNHLYLECDVFTSRHAVWILSVVGEAEDTPTASYISSWH